MTQQVVAAMSPLDAAKEKIADFMGYVRDAQMALSDPIFGEGLRALGLDAFSEKTLLNLANAIDRLNEQTLRDMPEDERREMEQALAATA